MRTSSSGLKDQRRKDVKDWVESVSRLDMFLKLKSEMKELQLAEDKDPIRGFFMKNQFIFTSVFGGIQSDMYCCVNCADTVGYCWE